MTTVNGLPAHILLVHAIVVLLPVAALLLVLTASWPAARRKLAGANAILSLLVVLLVPITTDAGEWLERRVPSTPLVHAHTELGDTAIWAAIPVAVLALVVWWRGREAAATTAALSEEHSSSQETGGTALAVRPAVARRTLLAPQSTVVTIVVVVLCVLAAGAACYDIVRIGDSGAQATWQGQFSTTPLPRNR
ncbi:hypothetical protein [Amycolatopsis sp. CA-230715]|uniref:hypothetical protein n=1 Tax=Amycolatopsis sp. CA-230715 TaxID=2745196 RepID=UPI001C019338|nr:hypothetical protein [Amycolatopsis sp. CA-230715]QWF77919.1 hypothetical protein HUW46_01312 [Amycolatopsis sp. CA-230715]